MPDKLEEAALSGVLFQERSPSPSRSISPNLLHSGDEEDEDEHFDTRQRNRQSSTSTSALLPPSHDGHHTGVKGVISDRDASERAQRTDAEQARRETAARQARQVISARTVEEEARLRMAEMRLKEQQAADDDDDGEAEAKARWRRARREEMEQARRAAGSESLDVGADGVHMGKRGGLREIGQEGFVTAVEQRGWVVVLIYEPVRPIRDAGPRSQLINGQDIARCQTLLASMLHLSLNMPPASSLPSPLAMYRARATSLRFSLLPASSGSNPLTTTRHDNEDDDDEAEEEEPEGRPDPDVLPTILAYKDGELEKTWIRADWDVWEDGVEGLLRR